MSVFLQSLPVMYSNENTALLHRNLFNRGLSVFFAVICVVDVFGVFPVVALPKPILDCGYYGIIVICLVCSVQIYTATLLGKCWNLAEQIYPNMSHKSRYPYSALAQLTFGKYSVYYVTFLLDLTIFGGGIPNLIVAAQNLELLGFRISNGSFNVSFCYWIIVLGAALCPVLWIGSPKDMKVLCTVSVLIVSSVYLLTCGCLIFTTNTSEPEENASFEANRTSLWELVMTAYGIVAFQFDIHPTILTIQMDMVDKTKLHVAVIGGFLVTLFMFGTTSLITSIKYGLATKPSILETLPTSVPLHFAAGLVAIQLCLTSAVSNSALYQHLEDCLNISRDFNYKRCILRTILTLLAIIMAESVPRFDLVMSLIGGTLIGPLVFILPPLFYVKMINNYHQHIERLERESFTNIVLTKPGSSSQKEEYTRDLANYYEARFKEKFSGERRVQWITYVWNEKVEIVLCCVIIIGSTLATGLTTYLNFVNAALSYANFSKPCIYNVSIALLYL